MIRQKTTFQTLCLALILSLWTVGQASAGLPTIDALTDGSVVMEVVNKKLTQLQIAKNYYIDGAKNAAKGYARKLVKIKIPFNINLPENIVPGSKKIANKCDLVDVKDPNSVKNAVYELFINIPKTDVNRRFYQENVVQANTVAHKLEARLDELEVAVDKLNTTLNSGGEGTEEATDNNAIWRNAYRAYDTFDKVLEVWEELIAIEGEYEAARVIRSITDPMPNSLKELEEQSFLTGHTQKYASAETLIFAQQTDSRELKDYSVDEYDRYKTDYVEFEEPIEAPIASPYEKKRKELQELKKLDPIYDNALQAIEVHNLIQSLGTTQQVFVEYERIKRLHEKSIEMLQLSEKCVMHHLGRYYNDPEKVWSGVKLGDHVYAHELRKGISGWAVNAFSVAKAQQPLTVEMEDIKESKIEYQGDPADLTTISQQPTPPASNSIGAGTQAKIEENNREVQLIAWQIGNEAAKMLAKDQHNNENKWGSASHKFPLWNDQKSFYNQYIDGKYDNIIAYLQFLDLRDKTLDLAYIINDSMVSIPGDKLKNKEFLDIIKKHLASDMKKTVVDEAASMQAIEKEREFALSEEAKNQQSQIAAQEAKKQALYTQIDQQTNKLNELNEAYNEAYAKIDETASTANNYRAEIDTAEKRYGDEPFIEVINSSQNQESTMEQTLRPSDAQTEITYKRAPDETIDQIDPGNMNSVLGGGTGTPVVSKREATQEVELGEKQQDVQSQTQAIEGIEATTKTTTRTTAPVYIQVDEQGNPISEPSSQGFRKRPSATGSQSFYQSSSALSFAQLMEDMAFGQEVEIETTEQTKEVGNITQEQITTIQGEGSIKTSETIEYEAINTAEPELQENDQPITAENYETEINRPEEETIEQTYNAKLVVQKDKQALVKEQIIDDLEGDIGYQNKLNQEAKATADALAAQIKDQEAIIERLRDQVAKIDEKITSIQNDYIAKVKAIETKFDQKMKAEMENYAKVRNDLINKRHSLSDLYKRYIRPMILATSGIKGALVSGLTLEKIIEESEDLIDGGRNYAIEAVKQARMDMYNLNDDLYFPKSNEAVVARHTELMKELQSMTPAKLINHDKIFSKYLTSGKIAPIITGLFQQTMADSACHQNTCFQPDVEYFIGYYGKDRDFMAPFAPPAIYMPNVRESVHFDTVDYQNLAKDKNGVTSRHAIMTYGSETPEIWKLILDENIFVEKQLDLKKLVNLGGEATLFMGGGRYPCNLDNLVVNIDAFRERYVISGKQASDANNPTCTDIRLEGSNTVHDLAYGATGKAVRSSASTIQELLSIVLNAKSKTLEDSTSELGIFINVDDNGNLLLNEFPKKVMEAIIKAETDENINTESEPKMEDAIYGKAVFDHNQIGDFLKFVELEEQYRQNKYEVELAINDIRGTLNEQLQKFGFEVNAELNLADKSEFDLIRNNLDQIKNKNISSTLPQIDAVNVINNPVAEERLIKLKNIYIALQKDKNELVSLSEVTDPGSSLDEKIKSEEVNQKAYQEYTKKAKEQMEQNLEQFDRPFCASY